MCRRSKQPFFIGLNRVMVSLGPLPDGRHCPYSCAFCYVNEGFLSYSSVPIPQIVEWVTKCDAEYDIIYVSGDTDSFAPPRTTAGIELLEQLADLGTDLLFTTRATFDTEELTALGRIAHKLAQLNRLLFGCISIPRLNSAEHLESINTPSPRERIATLKRLKEEGVKTLLTLRPFLPIIPAGEYREIIDLCRESSDLVLGEQWYVDEAGVIEGRVFQGPTPPSIKFASKKMDFDGNIRWWRCWEALELEQSLNGYCSRLKIPFVMRSQPAVDYLRAST